MNGCQQHKPDMRTGPVNLGASVPFEPARIIDPYWCLRCGALVLFDTTDDEPVVYAPEAEPEEGGEP